MKYIKFIDAQGNFRFSLNAEDGAVILKSDSYRTIHGYDHGIRSVRDNSPFDFRYEKLKVSNSQFFFVLKSTDDDIIGVSSFYNSLRDRDNAIEILKKWASDAPVERLIHSLI